MKAKLLKPHRHSGVSHQAGEVIELDEVTYEWLVNRKVATLVESTPIVKQRGQQQVAKQSEVIETSESATPTDE